MSLSKLNNVLFEQLDRLNSAKETGDALNQEIERSKAVSSIAKNITESAKIQLEALKVSKEWNIKHNDMPEALCNTQTK